MQKLILRDRILSTEKKAFIAGILNVTPDSFYSESRGGVEKAFSLIEEGADILDIGAESTRPGFTEVSVDEELLRLLPVIRQIRKKSNIPISIDTRKAQVFKACLDEGVDILNDVSALDFDSKMKDVVSASNVPVIMTHTFPHDRNENSPKIIKEISIYFENKIKFAELNGIKKDKIIIDPGIGFGKSFEENMILINECGKLCAGKFPIMMALSRKRCIGQMIGDMEKNRLEGTVYANIKAVEAGARIIRVHDVKEHVKVL
ncbi:MAG: dihydropteroate synthase [Treponema sp.]|nr:dihydropteroate synthase [Treponema sp.]